MNIVLLYLLLVKGTITAFAGLASLPVIQESLVNHYHVLTNEQLNEAVVITRSSPGPVGLYIVSVGYFAAGLPGAVAGWLAMITPALLIIPLVHFVGRRMEHPRVRSVLQTVVIASAGLLLAGRDPARAGRPDGSRHLDDRGGVLRAAAADDEDRHAVDDPRRPVVSLTASSIGLVAYL
jgi:chromate transporter